MPDAFDAWVARLEERHLANLTLSEIARGLRALSSAYVERRQTAIPASRMLDGAGKRAAFALYYGPLHFLATRNAMLEIVSSAPNLMPHPPLAVLDLGCGTGAVGAAAAAVTGAHAITGIDTHPWALDEARDTYASFGLAASLSRGSAARFRVPRHPALIVAGYFVNELRNDERARLLPALVDAVRRGSHVMIVEPLARSATPWWPEWALALAPCRPDDREWKLTVDPPDIVRRLGKAAGLTPTSINFRTLTAGVRS
jgi:SAM-dependent methyltransferase